MYAEAFVYGLVIGSMGCSLCSYPLISLSKDYKKSIVYLFLSRGFAALIALPLIFIIFYAEIIAVVVMLSIGIYSFMNAIEGNSIKCKSETSAITAFLCMFEGVPAVLAATNILEGIVSAYLFSLGTILPLLALLTFRKNIGSRGVLILSGMLITISIAYLYRYIAILGRG